MQYPWERECNKAFFATVAHVATGIILAAVLIVVEGMQRVAHSDDHRQVCPSHVLVLYNADWQESHPLIGAGQDSLAVAEHYARMRTDPASGEKPYILGLSCGAAGMDSPLNGDHLRETSSDNRCGVVYQPPGAALPESACAMRDSRLVEVALPEAEIPWDMSTLRVWLEPATGADDPDVLLVEAGQSLYPGQVQAQKQGQDQGDWQVRAHGRVFLQGRFTARAQCQDAQGALHEWGAAYHDFKHVSFSATGPDGVRDDQNYLDCVERPVKAFLEDPAHARPDGTLLKDHILYIVLAYGLPKTVSAPYGIACGITERLNNYGANIDFGQRLQIMSYDLDGLHREQVRPMRFLSPARTGPHAFIDHFFRTPLASPLWGPGINPFVHPEAYQRPKQGRDLPPPRFTAGQRAFRRDRHLFFSMRIDGVSAMQAMELADRAVYASRYAGPDMGVLPGVALTADPERTGDVSKPPADLFWKAGYRHLYRHPWGSGRVRVALLRMAPGTGFFNASEVFLPGGIATQVLSRSSWNRADSPLHEYLRQGVTVTAGAARAGGGAPHIHNKSFWDEEIFNPYLLKGYPVGEILLMNQMHLGWITSFVGDPLLRLPHDPPRPPALPGLSWEQNVTVKPASFPEQGDGFLVMVDLEATPEAPRVAQMRLQPAEADGDEKAEYVFERFSSRPYLFIPGSDPGAGGEWTMELIDPFGNRAELRGRLDEPSAGDGGGMREGG